MSCYHHLTILEREQILKYDCLGYSMRRICKELNRNVSTISRELKRNKTKKGYSPNTAQRQYCQRRKRCKRKMVLLQCPELRQMVHFCLASLWWSPEQVANRFQSEAYTYQISTSTIYRALENGCLRACTAYSLRIKKKKIGKAKKPRYTKFNSIHQRPEQANSRSELGHFEGDLVIVRKQKKAIFTCVDRCSRYLLADVLIDTDAPSALSSAQNIFAALPTEKRKTITLDRGCEFAAMPLLEDTLGICAYYCDPHSPQQKGTNENMNGLLRQFYPKRSITFPLDKETLSHFVALLNLRPRKCLGWKTPYEVFQNTVLHFT